MSASKSLEHPEEFFYAFAQLWCSVSSSKAACDKIRHDVHAIPRVRVDSTCKHMPYFRGIFSCPSDHLQVRRMVGEEYCEIF